MSDDSKQLSVAELLARNGQQGAASSGGGGRRRRSGRGISVAELTGDLPVIGGGGSHSAHAAPEEAASEPAAPAFEPAAYEPSAFGYQAPDPDPYAPPAAEPSYSPMSGPISMYNPLSAYAPAPAEPPRPADPPPPPGRSSRVMPGREMPRSSRHGGLDPLDSGTPIADPYAPAPSPDEYATDPLPPGGNEPLGSGRTGRRHRPDPDDRTTEVRPLGRPAPPPPADPVSGGRAARRRAREEAEDAGPATAAWSPNVEAAPEPPPSRDPGPRAQPPARPAKSEVPPPDSPGRSVGRQNGRGAGDGGLPAWSARRHKSQPPAPDSDSGGISTAAWSLASQDQQLLSGQTVAGDLLRDGAERAERDANRGRNGDRGRKTSFRDRVESRVAERGKRGRAQRDDPPDGEFDDAFEEGATDVYAPIGMAGGAADEHDDDAAQPDSGRAVATKTGPRRSRAARKAEAEADDNRRQWLILGGQSAGAAVAGMLLFKGFEQMWETLPWVALALAMVVILGLVALVRILRRTDDILSTVIAVVVGIFATLGPLAFLLSTN